MNCPCNFSHTWLTRSKHWDPDSEQVCSRSSAPARQALRQNTCSTRGADEHFWKPAIRCVSRVPPKEQWAPELITVTRSFSLYAAQKRERGRRRNCLLCEKVGLLRVKLHNLFIFKASRFPFVVAEKDKLIPHVASRQALSVFQGKHMQLVSGLVESPQGKHGVEGAEAEAE